jgi:hypothetical protein
VLPAATTTDHNDGVPSGAPHPPRVRLSFGAGRRVELDWRLFALAGLVVVYLLSTLTFEYVESSATASTMPVGRLDRAHTFGQTFLLKEDNLVGVRVYLDADPQLGAVPVTLRLRYTDPGRPSLVVATLPADALVVGAPAEFAFAPVMLAFPPHVVTTTLRFDLEAPAVTPPQSIAVLGGANTYSHGELFAGETSRPDNDLAFELLYQRRWIDAVLPISRIAYGRAGVFGWPPFYALLAYLWCLALGRALLALWRLARTGS